ncbi:MAG: LptF/LptG family permease [Planctomycetes bacterium]|nr:LptF/LptG family permease [Planctomycetota bacterium]
MLITLPLYILRELGKALGLALLVFSFVMLAVPAGQVIRDGAGFFTVFSIIPRLFPLISPMVLPLTIVTGTLVAYGRLSGNNEYVAAQAGGVHPIWLSGPAFIIAILATTITLYLNDTVLTDAANSINNSILSDKTDILRRRLSKPGSFLFNNMAICRLESEGDNSGIDITFFGEGPDKKNKENPRWDPEYPHQMTRVIARDHEIDLDEDKVTGELFIEAKLKKFQRFQLETNDQKFADTGNLKWSAGTKDTDIAISPDRLSYTGIGKLVDLLRERRSMIRQSEQEIADAGKNPETAQQVIATQTSIINNYEKSLFKITAELNIKLALSFSCFGFALLGVPLGLRAKTGKATIGFAYGFGIALIYMLTTKGFHLWARLGKIPAALIWLPTITLILAGAWMWYRSRRAD